MSENIFSFFNFHESIEVCVNTFKKVTTWMDEHREEINKFLTILGELSFITRADKKLIENQILFTDYYSFDFAKKICETDDVNEIINEYYFSNGEMKLKNIIKRCSQSSLLKNKKSFSDNV